MRHLQLLSALVLLGAGLAAHADNLVSNPDFASTNQTFPGYTSSTNNQMSGWTGTGSYGSTGYNVNGFWNNGSLPSGDSSVGFIQTSGSLSTTLNNLVAGQTYVLSFLTNSRSFDGDLCCNATPYISAAVGGTSLMSGFADPSVGGTNAFRSVSTTFQATGSTEMLTLSSSTNGGADGTALFSNVAVATAPTPEPSSFVLLGSGLLGAAGMLRRRFA